MKHLFSLFLSLSFFSLWSQDMLYSANLIDIEKDRVTVSLKTKYQGGESVNFNFPMTIPGTYAILDYGRYIKKFKAFDSKGTALKVKKEGNNTFVITPGADIATITYLVDDSWEEGKNKIFEPAGTGFEANNYFYINSAGLFGYFENDYNRSYQLQFKKPSHLTGYTTLNSSKNEENLQVFEANNYHLVVDNPILFTEEKAHQMMVGNTTVSCVSYFKEDKNSGLHISTKIDSAMIAIDQFTGGNLPTDRYAFLNYVQGYPKIAKMMDDKHLGLFKIIRVLRTLLSQGFGALEHGNSSAYYMPDFGNQDYVDMISSTAIHEFMHIYTPLSLHSQHIGDFNYTQPIMSKHLWLYEGVTEYFAVIIGMQGGLNSVDNTLSGEITSKIRAAASYPDTLPFTVMSANVFDKPYSKQYGQVYQRGAIMAMLLDIEIMHLTQGEKTLKSVIFELVEDYGSKKSFDEDGFIADFVSKVHPDLQMFFNNYVTGKKALPIKTSFAKIGIEYLNGDSAMAPTNVFGKAQGVKVKRAGNLLASALGSNTQMRVKKAKEGNIVGLKKGDLIDSKDFSKLYRDSNNEYVADGTIVSLDIIRNGENMQLSFPAKFEKRLIKHQVKAMQEMTTEQKRLFKLWTTGVM